jgi:hypothetical protein
MHTGINFTSAVDVLSADSVEVTEAGQYDAGVVALEADTVPVVSTFKLPTGTFEAV